MAQLSEYLRPPSANAETPLSNSIKTKQGSISQNITSTNPVKYHLKSNVCFSLWKGETKCFKTVKRLIRFAWNAKLLISWLSLMTRPRVSTVQKASRLICVKKSEKAESLLNSPKDKWKIKWVLSKEHWKRFELFMLIIRWMDLSRVESPQRGAGEEFITVNQQGYHTLFIHHIYAFKCSTGWLRRQHLCSAKTTRRRKQTCYMSCGVFFQLTSALWDTCWISLTEPCKSTNTHAVGMSSNWVMIKIVSVNIELFVDLFFFLSPSFWHDLNTGCGAKLWRLLFILVLGRCVLYYLSKNMNSFSNLNSSYLIRFTHHCIFLAW